MVSGVNAPSLDRSYDMVFRSLLAFDVGRACEVVSERERPITSVRKEIAIYLKADLRRDLQERRLQGLHDQRQEAARPLGTEIR